MKNKIVLFSVLAVFALFAVIAVPSVSATYPANAVYFEPEDSSAKFCENTYVQIMVNANVKTTGAGMDIYFDPNCVNITNVDFTGTPYNALTGWTHWGNYVRIGVMGPMDPIQPGTHLIANLTLHCVNKTDCTSNLVFTETELLDYDGDPLPDVDVTWHDGTFTCEKPPEKPDLNVTEITVNYDASSLGGRAVGPEPGPGVHTQCNNISAVIEEDNGVATGAFDVTFKVDGTTLCTMRVPGLTGGATKTVYCNCSWYPMAGDAFAINVTVDSNDEILESDETNNTMWNKGTVVSNGYKGDGWQGPDKNLTNVQCHDQDTINLIYSVGDSYYAKGNWSGTTEYVVTWTTSDLPVPEGADIEKAWLYVYYTWDKEAVMPDEVSLTFNGNSVLYARHYTDRKGFGSYNYPYGMVVYDVTPKFVATAPNKAVLSKPAPDTYIPIKGMLLMVVYNHPDEPVERIICINEGYDMINAQASYGVTPEEATTYATFKCCEPIPLSEIEKATLVAVAPGASKGDDKNRLSFNDGLWKGAWSGFAGSTELGIAETDVLDYLKEENNVANFQDRGDWMEASNAFLILEKPPVEKPDLVIEKSVTIEDGNITVNYTVKNIGDGPAGASNTTIYIDSVNVLEDPVPALASGDSFTNTVGPFDCPCDTTLNVTVCADNDNVVDESDETNNCEVNIIECPGKPDLVITEKYETFVDGGSFNITYKVNNIGCADAGASNTTIYIDGVPLEVPTPAIPRGECHENTVGPFDCPCGVTLNVTVCADNDNVVDESNETNNCEVNIIECPGKPDLVITEKYETSVDGGSFNITYKVNNIGCADAGASSTTIYIDGVPLEVPTPAIPRGECHENTVGPFECPCGATLNVTACADNDNVVDESNETNNCLENEWICGKPDLVIEKSVTIEDSNITVNYTVKNIGDGPAGPSNTTIYIDSVNVLEDPVPALASGDSFTNTVGPFDCPCDTTLNVTVCADNDNVVDESDETNNCEINIVECPPCMPDLVITDIWTVGNKIHYTIKNKGCIPVGRSYSGLYIDGRYLARDRVDGLDPGESSTESFGRYDYTPGDTVKVCADYQDRIEESDETNNCRREWEPGPDLVIEDKWEEWINATHYSVTYVIHNKGTATALKCHNTTLYVDGVEIEHKHVPVDLAPCDTYEDTFDTVIECMDSSDTIKVCADNFNEVIESNEENNCLENEWLCVLPDKPDLVITDIELKDNKICYTIENQGGAAAGISYTGLWIDGRYSARDSVNGLRPGESSIECFERYNYRGGEIKVCADYQDRIAEIDETNNCMEA